MTEATIQIYFNAAWHDAATVHVHNPDLGWAGECSFTYTTDYFANFAAEPFPAAALGCNFPVDYEYREVEKWPAFLLDILPAGAGRVHWLEQLNLGDGPEADWQLLLNGAGNPPGNLRIEGAIDRREIIVPTAEGKLIPNTNHPGFTRDDIVDRQEYFIEYAAQNGAHVAGCSDVQGVAPKFLLQQDRNGRWHAEGALPDTDVMACWIVKFPRGKTEDDRKVLRNEAPYIAVAKAIGLKAFDRPTEWDGDALFVPRFDRIVTDAGIERLGMESLYSLANITGYGVAVNQDRFADAIGRFATDPFAELLEFVRRDIFNVAVGNKDNHGRNTAVLRLASGTVTLTPLFDVAPMYLDPEGVARVCRWDGDAEKGGQPIWGKVAEALPIQDKVTFRKRLAVWAKVIDRLPDHMRNCGVDDDIIQFRTKGIEEQARLLRDAKPQVSVLVNGGGFAP